jgi:hypothetical protein
MDRIDGDVLLGFGDFFSGYDDIGADKKAPPAKKGAAPVQVLPYVKPKRTQTVQQHGKVLRHAHDVALKAAQSIGQAQHLLARKAMTVTPPRPVASTRAAAAKLAGRRVSVGADVAAKMSPRAALAVKRHNDAVTKSRQAAKVLAQHALKTKASVQALAKHMVTQKKLSKTMRTPAHGGVRHLPTGKMKTPVHVGALLADPVVGPQVAKLFHDYYTTIGADPDPSNPGYLTDGSPDPAMMPVDASADPTLADPTLSDPSLAADDSPVDSGQDLPPPADMSTFIPDMAAVGGIAYNGSKGTPSGYVVSYGLATRKTDIPSGYVKAAGIDPTEHYGYVFGRYHDDGAEKGVPFGDFKNSTGWNHVHGRYHSGIGSWHNPCDPSEAFGSNSKTNPKGVSYGPLVGNPSMPDFKGMRVDAQGNMFWLPQEAPDWLTFPLKQAAAMTAQAAAKAAADAAAADAAAAAKAQADAAAAQAAQDAANALSESQSASQQKIAQGEAETQAQQALVQQQQADTAAQAVETEQTKQAGQLLLSQAQQDQEQGKQVQDLLVEQAKREQAYLAQHPEVEFAPEAEEGGDVPPPDDVEYMPGVEGSGGEGGYDDGMPVPGGDVMADADGEGFQDDEA